jgi:hypothetical protein
MRELLTPRPRRSRAALALTLVAVLATGAACSDDGADTRGSGSASGSGSGAGSGPAVAGECAVADGTDGVDDADTVIDATLDEWSIQLDPTTVDTGAIGFTVENAGERDHEIVIAAAKVDDIEVVDGKPDEDALGDAVIGEVEAFPAGETCEGTFDLEPGSYVAFCALVDENDDGSTESHFENGMVTSFTVS